MESAGAVEAIRKPELIARPLRAEMRGAEMLEPGWPTKTRKLVEAAGVEREKREIGN